MTAANNPVNEDALIAAVKDAQSMKYMTKQVKDCEMLIQNIATSKKQMTDALEQVKEDLLRESVKYAESLKYQTAQVDKCRGR